MATQTEAQYRLGRLLTGGAAPNGMSYPRPVLNDTGATVAEAEVSYACGDTPRRLERLQSGGVWGVCDADVGYRRELALEELADLKNHLGRFGVVLDTFDALAAAALASVS